METPAWATEAGVRTLDALREAYEKVSGKKAKKESPENEKKAARDLAITIYNVYKLSSEEDREHALRIRVERLEGEKALMKDQMRSAKGVQEAMAQTCERLGRQLEEARSLTPNDSQQESDDG